MEARRTCTLRAVESYPDDVGNCRIRLESDVMSYLQLSNGDIVRLEGHDTAFALAYHDNHRSGGVETVRIDGFSRWNIDIELDDEVTIWKSNPLTEAVQVVLELPSDFKCPMSDEENDIIHQQLIGIPVVSGQVVPIELSSSMAQSGQNILGISIAEIMPEKSAIIGSDTTIVINENGG